MKILLINKYHYVRGGSETYYFGLAELLRNAGHDVLFFAMEDARNNSCEQSRYFVSNVEFNGELSTMQKLRAAGRLIYSFEAKKKLDQLLRDEKPDIIHINLFHRVLTASIIDVAKKHNIPIVFTVHDVNCLCPNHTMLDHGKICEACLHGNYWNCVQRVCFKDSRLKAFMAAAESWYNAVSHLYRKIDLFITPSDFYRKKILEAGITNSPVMTMRNFLPLGTPLSSCGTHKGYYLYFGRLSQEKGVLTLLSAIKQLPHVRLEIAGTGPEEQTLQDFVTENDLSDRVHFNGFMSGHALKDMINGAKCVILPSEWYENGPYSIMEAQASGKPVIVSNLGGLPEIVEDGHTGFICTAFDSESLANSIMQMENLTKKEYDDMSAAAIESAMHKFNADSYLKELTRHYEDLVKKGSTEPCAL